jgi:hypothetical protein
MEANANRYHGKAPDEIACGEPERQTRAVKEYFAAGKFLGWVPFGDGRLVAHAAELENSSRKIRNHGAIRIG